MSTASASPSASPQVSSGPSVGSFIDLRGEEPIRAEIFGLEHLEAHARALAGASVLSPRARLRRSLLRRFAHNGRVLAYAHRRITEAARRQEPLTPDAEWLLDNFYIIEDVLREVRQDLPRGYYDELPKLADGPLAGYPRIYALALALIAHTDSSLDEAHLGRFVRAYQAVAPLTIGELWAVPTMLRLGVLENLARLAEQMLRAWTDRRRAEAWIARHLVAEPRQSRVEAGMARPHESRTPPVFLRLPADVTDPFIVRLLQELRDQGPSQAEAIEWLETQLAQGGVPAVDVLRREHQRQAANQVSIGNCVTSLRLLAALDWSVFFEQTSLVEAMLREDPSQVYARQDFATRDRYRRAVEQLARGAELSELQVARRVLELAREGTDERRRHIGYYLVDRGRSRLEADLKYRPRLRDRILRAVLDHPHAVYFGALGGVFALLLAGGLALLGGSAPLGWLLVVALVLLLPLSELSVGLVNYLLTLYLPPRTLPKLGFKEGIPPDCTTLVVMPSMLIRRESAAVLLEKLEVHYLANPDPRLRFALLTDFADAPSESMPEDEAYLQTALEGVRALNERYPLTTTEGSEVRADRFFLFHRARRWNPSQGCWMGWERKRGKLDEFNRLLRGATDTSFVVQSGDVRQLPRVRFVITLDVDTQLPRETARRLIGTLAHPLNQPVYEPRLGRVVEGYGVLQPRVTFHLLAASRSLFARIFAASAGIDPYATAVSDVYQDLFGAGTYTGKGIYDVDAFLAAAGHTFPDNHILSHDLIEGNYARCGLVTDIELLDDFPARYHAYARREHRWARGDWQLLPWLLGRGPCPADRAQPPAPLPLLERWKVFDNLRRSLVPPALIVLLVLGWTVLPGSAWWWTAGALLVLALPLLLQVFGTVLSLLRGTPVRAVLGAYRDDLPATAGQVLLATCFLADQARHLVDAIVRTVVRLYVTRRHLLEWETAATTERRLGTGFSSFLLCMWPVLLLALLVTGLVAFVAPERWSAAAPLLALWFVSPAVAWWVSQPRLGAEVPLTPAERRELRRIARKTWSFFETYVGDEDHWLPPDNYQEDPKGQVAHRTSPTNQGLLLLSTLAAHDLGYLSLRSLLERLEKTIGTLEQLERYHGHFHNWYDTRTLRSLQPVYISTVDSGNLLGCLVALKQGLREKIEEPLLGPATLAGLADTLDLVAQSLRSIEPPSTAEAIAVFRALEADLRELEGQLRDVPADLLSWDERLRHLARVANGLPARVRQLAALLHETPSELETWAQRIADLVHARRAELAETAPWLDQLLSAGNGKPGTEPRWEKFFRLLAQPLSVAELHSRGEALRAELAALGDDGASLAALVERSTAAELLSRCHALADRAAQLANQMDFSFLYNEQRHLFAIGYNLTLGRLDNAYYDLLASESCLTSFLTVARGEVPKRHWFQLGRPLTRAAGNLALLSWGGTMFEYLMPRLLLRTYPGTLLDMSMRAALGRQMEYGRQQGVPWGVSESAFAALDVALDYQYQSFGVPGLGLKRGLAQDLVIAPYACGLAVMFHPHEALANFRRLAAEGGEGRHGFYEAIDYTSSRLPKGQRALIVRSYMAHHQGMALVAMTNCLLGDVMPRRFHREPLVRAADMLLQERMPRGAPLREPHGEEVAARHLVPEGLHAKSRRLTTAATPSPRTHLLSNGQYSVMLTNAGSGFSSCRGLAITRWREDRTCDTYGQFFYIRDLRSSLVWSAGHQPMCRPADEYEVVYSADMAEIRRIDATIETRLEVVVSPENNAEVRRLTLTNHDSRAHDLEVTSYAEVVLAPHAADLAHPAFGKLFLETEWLEGEEALLCRRRPRSPDQKPVWGIHVLAVEGHTLGPAQYETDRARFLGRGRTPAHPAALDAGSALSGTTGAVLDPVFSLRRRVRLQPGASASLAFTTAFAESREEALNLADQYHDYHAITRAFELAWAHAHVELRHLHLTAEEVHLYHRLAAHLFYASPALRAAPGVLLANTQGQSGLWRHGISGDRPILLARVAEMEELPLVSQLLVAHTYWRLKGLQVDLVLLNEHPTSYFEELHQQMQALVRGSDAHALLDRPGGVFIRKATQISDEDRLLLQASARVVLVGSRGSLASQADRLERPVTLPDRLVRRRRERDARRNGVLETGRSVQAPSGLQFANGFGGFTPDGREYVIEVRSGHGSPLPSAPALPLLPPAPWINVIANPNAGFLVSESGAGYTWAGNSQQNRLTAWSNDPVTDPASEVVYLRDEETGEAWTPTPLPIPSGAPVVVRHGQGYTTFAQESHGLAQELVLFVPPTDPVKLLVLRLRNTSGQTRRLSATFFAEWVLGTVRDQAAMHVATEMDETSGALLAHNRFNADFGNCVAFVDVNRRPRTLTGDRTEFLGRNGSVATPAALERVELSGRTGPGIDPCAAVQTAFELAPGEEQVVIFLLGQASSVAEAREILARYRDPEAARAALTETQALWDRILMAVQVRTPSAALDVLLNRWLLYQVLSCRFWGRSAFYQSGGAYGYRDQLQDSMALVYGAPQEARAHLLRAARRQFLEGDVQHWWHPPAGRGVRTRFSDDYLWLPFVTAHYVAVTGDAAVLDERVPFIRSPLLKPEQEEEYGLPEVTEESASLYEHCLRALEHGLRFGAHGLPLMGIGDWNDGMNRVGSGGQGESVWVGWFLITCLRRFAELADARGDHARAVYWREQADRIHQAVEAAWDGAWYRRAYFDDGTPLGSAQNDECRIDSIAQTWAVLSGAGDAERARQAMQAVHDQLVRPEDRLILLFTPPFDHGKLHPGYIKGYVPGIRENGGQYTHAATWVVQAAAQLGQGSRAMELYDLLNPVLHAQTPEEVARYKVEPYVVAADVYGAPPHTGRGGWTWYTGSAAWLYRVALEAILGFHLRGNQLVLDPRIPASWPRYTITYRFRTSTYRIQVENPAGVESGVRSATVDGREVPGGVLDLQDDGQQHEIRILLGR